VEDPVREVFNSRLRMNEREPQAKEFKYLGVLFTSEGQMEGDRQADRCSCTGPSGEEELSRMAKLSICWSVYVPTLTDGHELWVVTERTRSRIQAAKMSFLHRAQP